MIVYALEVHVATLPRTMEYTYHRVYRTREAAEAAIPAVIAEGFFPARFYTVTIRQFEVVQ